MEGQKIWSNILSSIKSQISLSSYKAWFLGSFVLDYKKNGDKNLLVIGVRNNFLKEQIETKYSPIISETIKLNGDSNIEFVFVVAQKENKKTIKNEPLFSGVPQRVIANGRKAEALNPSHILGNFVVGPSNNLAFLAAQQVTANLGLIYNPLLFYGPSGVGKTHLLQAIGNEVLEKFIDAKVLYVTAEKFTNDFIESLGNRTQASFRQKYRGVDLLLIDDIQFLAGKESTQDEFAHTFNDLLLLGKQVVIVSDQHPKELGRLKERLVSRFLGGMTANISLPDLEMRVAILKAKCQEKAVHLDEEIIYYLAQSSMRGARELEGLLVSVLALMKLSGGKATLDDIKAVVEKNRLTEKPTATPGKIIEAVCKHFKLSSGDLRGSSRKASLVFARQILMYLLRKKLGLPLEQVGEIIGGRDHSTVIYGVEKIERVLLHNQSMSDEVLRIETLINNNY